MFIPSLRNAYSSSFTITKPSCKTSSILGHLYVFDNSRAIYKKFIPHLAGCLFPTLLDFYFWLHEMFTHCLSQSLGLAVRPHQFEATCKYLTVEESYSRDVYPLFHGIFITYFTMWTFLALRVVYSSLFIVDEPRKPLAFFFLHFEISRYTKWLCSCF